MYAERQAFTLIELLVVISIVAVLAGMLLPAVNLVRTAARQTVCGGNQRQISLALEGYRVDWEGVIPAPLTNPAGDSTPGSGNNYAPDDYYCQWYAPLRSYLDTPENSNGTRVWICPDSNWRSRLAKSFGLSYGMNGGSTAPGARVFPFRWAGTSLTSFRNPSGLVVIGERRAVGLTAAADYNGTVSPPYHSAPQTVPGTAAGDPAALRATHGGRSVYLFADWHVESLTPNQRCNPANTPVSPQLAPNIWLGL